MYSCSKCSGHLERNYDNPAKKIFDKLPNFFAQVSEIFEKYKF